MCALEAVARVYLYKQTAVAYEAGRPDDLGRGKKFEIGDLYDVIRTMHPTREMIIAAWSQSLEFSVGTSSYGVNVMTAVAEKFGLVVDSLFRRLPSEPAAMLAPANPAETVLPWTTWMSQRGYRDPSGTQRYLGASAAALAEEAARLGEERRLRNDFRCRAVGQQTAPSTPLNAIESVVGREEAAKYAGALFPTAVEASLYYKPKALLYWAVGRKAPREDVLDADRASESNPNPLRFREHSNEGGAKTYDFAWLSLASSERGRDSAVSWTAVGGGLKGLSSASRFDMHVAGIADCLFMLSSAENARLLPQTPRVPAKQAAALAMVDHNDRPLPPNTTDVTEVGLAQHAYHDGFRDVSMGAHEGAPVEARLPGSATHRSNVPLHEQLDKMNERCRLPKLQPHMSSRVEHGPPIRKIDGALLVNSVVVFEHVCMVMEATIACSRLDGLKNLQERFYSATDGPPGLRAFASRDASVPEHVSNRSDPDLVHTMPYSVDITQIMWTLDLARRFYTPDRKGIMDTFNAQLAADNLESPLDEDDVIELSLIYQGFPDPSPTATPALRLLSVQLDETRAEGRAEVPLEKSNPIQDISAECLRYETEMALGRHASELDIEEHRKVLLGSGYTYGVTGDLYSYDTYCNHLQASMIARGNTNGQRGDAGLVSLLGAETMLDARMYERQVMAGVISNVALPILPRGSTYSYLRRHKDTQATSSSASGVKRTRMPPEAQRSARTSGATMAKQRYSTDSTRMRVVLRDSRDDEA